MKRPLALLLIVALSSCASSNKYIKNPERYAAIRKVAVLPFSCQDKAVGEAISGGIAARLISSAWTVVSDMQFKSMMRDQGMPLDSTMDYSKAIGKLKGIDAIVTGSASTFDLQAKNGSSGGDLVTGASAQLIDMTTGDALAAATYSHDINGWGMRKSPTEVGEALAEQLMP